MISKEEAYKIYKMVKEDKYPPTNPVILSKAIYHFAKEGKPKISACIASWLIEVEGGYVPSETWEKLCQR